MIEGHLLILPAQKDEKENGGGGRHRGLVGAKGGGISGCFEGELVGGY